MRKIVVICVVWMFCAVPAWALVEIEGFFWLMTPEGQASVGIDGLEGTKIDLENDFGYGDMETVPGFRFIIGNTHQLGLSIFKLDASASNTLDRTIHFGDEEFTINENISSSIEMTVMQGLYRFNIGPETFHGGLMIGGEYFAIEVKAASGTSGSAKADADFGMLFFGGFVESDPFSFLRLRASLLGGAWEIGDVEADYLELEVSVLAKIPPLFYIGAGYRQIIIDAKDKSLPLEVDLTFKGPTLFIGFEW
jgi:hypothetical protein